VKEGFESSSLETNYKALQAKLKNGLASYCTMTEFIQNQMKTMYQSSTIQTDQVVTPPPPPPTYTTLPGPTKSTGFWGDNAAPLPKSGDPSTDAMKNATASTVIPGATDLEAGEKIRKAYQDAYACKDELADSRQSCSGFAKLEQMNVKMDFIPCTVYMNTPAYDESDTLSAAVALSDIPDNLALRITKEVDWYYAIINKLKSGIDAGANPPASLPADAPGADYKAPPDQSSPPSPPGKKEGFAGAKCSPEAMRLRQQKLRQRKQAQLQQNMAREQSGRQQRLDAESDTCAMPDLQGEIDRVNGILDSDALISALERCDVLADAAKKLQLQLALLKDGNLYDWQKSGPTKSYAQFKGGDRIAGLTFSIQQNR
jgi:hypothetical protein